MGCRTRRGALPCRYRGGIATIYTSGHADIMPRHTFPARRGHLPDNHAGVTGTRQTRNHSRHHLRAIYSYEVLRLRADLRYYCRHI